MEDEVNIESAQYVGDIFGSLRMKISCQHKFLGGIGEKALSELKIIKLGSGILSPLKRGSVSPHAEPFNKVRGSGTAAAVNPLNVFVDDLPPCDGQTHAEKECPLSFY